jgi:hypothetical protein
LTQATQRIGLPDALDAICIGAVGRQEVQYDPASEGREGVTRNHRCKTMNKLLDNARYYLDSYVWRRRSGIKAALAA